MSLPWTDKGRSLLRSEIGELLRDASAVLGKCGLDTTPSTILAKSVTQLRFDNPPLKGRPDHQKRALVYAVASMLSDANVFISTTHLPVNYFADNSSAPLRSAADHLFEKQEYPAR